MTYEIRDRFDPNVLPIETHETKEDAVEALGQWKIPDDRVVEDVVTRNLFIAASDYYTDIFALFVE